MSTKIAIHVIPRSSKNQIIPQPDGSLKIKLTTPPVDGAANEALIKLLSEYFHIPKTKIAIRKGLRGKNKIVEMDNTNALERH